MYLQLTLSRKSWELGTGGLNKPKNHRTMTPVNNLHTLTRCCTHLSDTKKMNVLFHKRRLKIFCKSSNFLWCTKNLWEHKFHFEEKENHTVKIRKILKKTIIFHGVLRKSTCDFLREKVFIYRKIGFFVLKNPPLSQDQLQNIPYCS